MSQCEEHSPYGGIRCVMEAGHAPLGAGPDGTLLVHNFGGLGPYTPMMPDLVAAHPERVQRWTYSGVVLNTDDKGQVSLDELKEFVTCVERLEGSAQAEIRIHEFGLRATRLAGKGGPHLDWRD